MEKKQKNIEFFRFLFIIIIIYFHITRSLIVPCGNFLSHLQNNCFSGHILVEFYFLLSGVFLYKKITSKTTEMVFFVKSRISRLLPIILFSTALVHIIAPFAHQKQNIYNDILMLLGFQGTGLMLEHASNIPIWYVGVLFWVSLFYVYLSKCVDSKKFNLITAVIVFCCFIFVVSVKQGDFGNYSADIIAHFQNGLLRGLASVGLGYFLGMLIFSNDVKKFRIFKNKTLDFILFSAFEIYFAMFLINNTMFHKISFNNELIFVLIEFLLILLMFVNKGLLSKILDNNLSVVLGKYSYAIYVMQCFTSCLAIVLNLTNSISFIGIIVIMTIVVGVLSDITVKKLTSFFHKFF